MSTSATIHKYPGLGLPLRYFDEWNHALLIGAHNNCYLTHSELIFVRELAMMRVMDKLTDEPDWHKKVFDEAIVAKWQKEALAIPDEECYRLATSQKRQSWMSNDGRLSFCDDRIDEVKLAEGIMSQVTFDCCIKELRDKAKYFEQTSIIPTLDACASVAKSDSLVTDELRKALRDAFDKLKADQRALPDWHPNSDDRVQDLVHPSMHPLVYGRTRAFREDCVGVGDAIKRWAGKGTVIPKDDWKRDPVKDRDRYNMGEGAIPPEYWSETYQWLPANVAFQNDGSVKFTSYINNLHPVKYPDIYRTIEKLVQISIPMWDQCIVTINGTGRTDTRLGRPYNADDNYPENWIPDNPEDCADAVVSLDQLEAAGYNPECHHDVNEYKWKVVRKPRLPEPSYTSISYTPREGERLIEFFRETGLQIIVKMASIELTPDKPDFPVGGWHVEGQMNEHICATALYCLDSENITDSNHSFRTQTDVNIKDSEDYNAELDGYHWMESVFATKLGGRSSPCLQNYGTVKMRQGRLLAFPNVFHHQVSPVKLIDPTMPGHCRFIALWLVDPAERIISTANVPPQQMDWYAESLLGSTPEARKEALAKLPAELVALVQERSRQFLGNDQNAVGGENPRLPEELIDMVREYLEADGQALPMSADEARQHWAKLTEERSAFVRTAENGWQQARYSFDEDTVPH